MRLFARSHDFVDIGGRPLSLTNAIAPFRKHRHTSQHQVGRQYEKVPRLRPFDDVEAVVDVEDRPPDAGGHCDAGGQCDAGRTTFEGDRSRGVFGPPGATGSASVFCGTMFSQKQTYHSC